MIITEPSWEAQEHLRDMCLDLIDAASKVSIRRADFYGPYEANRIAFAIDAEPYQILAATAGLVRKLAERLPERAEVTLAEIRRSVAHGLMTRRIDHDYGQLQLKVLKLATAEVPPELITPLAQKYCDGDDHTVRLQLMELGVHLVAWTAALSGDGAAALADLAAEVAEKFTPQSEEKTE
jgi:hypothetical protein